MTTRMFFMPPLFVARQGPQRKRTLTGTGSLKEYCMGFKLSQRPSRLEGELYSSVLSNYYTDTKMVKIQTYMYYE